MRFSHVFSYYRHSAKVVYNNFPWHEVTEAQKDRIAQTAQAILDARALYPGSPLADLYDEITMPPELREAHKENNKAVMLAYEMVKTVNGRKKLLSKSETVARLFELYEEITKSSFSPLNPKPQRLQMINLFQKNVEQCETKRVSK